jgi:hypothetical protein
MGTSTGTPRGKFSGLYIFVDGARNRAATSEAKSVSTSIPKMGLPQKQVRRTLNTGQTSNQRAKQLEEGEGSVYMRLCYRRVKLGLYVRLEPERWAVDGATDASEKYGFLSLNLASSITSFWGNLACLGYRIVLVEPYASVSGLSRTLSVRLLTKGNEDGSGSKILIRGRKQPIARNLLFLSVSSLI